MRKASTRSRVSVGILMSLVGLVSAAAATAAEDPSAVLGGLQWRNVGPFRGGRTRAVAGVPGHPSTFYVGAVNGGVWKTDDSGRTWQPIFDDQPTQSIGAIAVAPSAPATIYVGTGEGLHRPDLSVGNGMYRSDDSGQHWRYLGLPDAQQIPEVAVDPRTAETVYAAVLGHPFGPSEARGVYRSRDGGRTWKAVLQLDAHTGANGVAIDPKHPDTVYATLWEDRLGPWEDRNEYHGTAGGLYRSIDGGDHWERLGADFPKNTTQINLAVAPSRPERLYAMVATTDPGDYNSSNGLGLWRSDDSGAHFVRATEDPRAVLRIGGGDHAIVRVDPNDADSVYTASIVAMQSHDGGKTFDYLRGGPGGDDYQNLWISPDNGKVIALVGDQGALISENGGRTWSSWLNQSTAQLYHASVTPTFPYRICSGQQESGSVCISSRGNDGEITMRDWHPVGAIEYGYVAPDPLNPDLIYGAGRTEVTRFHVSTGRVENISPFIGHDAGIRTVRTEPLMFSPLDPHVLYFAASRLFRTVDGGRHWETISPDLSRPDPAMPASVGERHPADAAAQRGAIYALAPSPRQKGLLWAGTDDGLVWRTDDEGAHWQNVTPPSLTAWSKVTQIDASHFDSAEAVASVSRLRIDDLSPIVLRTRDGGAHWESIVHGLEDAGPVNAVREDPIRRGLLYAATERGVYISFDDGDHWLAFNQNLPHTSARDVVVKDADLIVATHGRGFWVLDDIARLRAWQPGVMSAPWLVNPSPALRVARSTWSDTPIAPDEPVAANPPVGAVIDYAVPAPGGQPVLVRILDAAGRAVRVYTSHDAQEPTDEELARELIPSWWVEVHRPLSATAGMHRLIWDLRWPAPRTTTKGFPIGAVVHGTPREPEGLTVPPGLYTVELTVGTMVTRAPLEVRPDPRLTTGAVAQIGVQYAALQPLYAAFDQMAYDEGVLHSLLQQVEVADEKVGRHSAAHEVLEKAAARFHAVYDTPPKGAKIGAVQSMMQQLGELYAALGRGDEPPNSAQAEALTKALSAAGPTLAEASTVLQSLPALNARLKSAHVALDASLPPTHDGKTADVDED
jgi:photosystem II stability/assembly factor-like uncharacterized protein